jgi:hypothetical protein
MYTVTQHTVHTHTLQQARAITNTLAQSTHSQAHTCHGQAGTVRKRAHTVTRTHCRSHTVTCTQLQAHTVTLTAGGGSCRTESAMVQTLGLWAAGPLPGSPGGLGQGGPYGHGLLLTYTGRWRSAGPGQTGPGGGTAWCGPGLATETAVGVQR